MNLLLALNSDVWAALAGAAVAGVTTIVISVISYIRDEKQLREQHRQRSEEWFREKLAVSYSDCIYYLVKLTLSSMKHLPSDDKDVRQHFAESQRYLVLLRIYQTEESSSDEESPAEKLKNCNFALEQASDDCKKLSEAADAAANTVKEIMERDMRIPITAAPKTS